MSKRPVREMDEQELQDHQINCIVNTSTEYARSYIKQATIDTLQKCLDSIEGRAYSVTLRRIIEARIKRLEREADIVAYERLLVRKGKMDA